jgi:dTDP-4-dehydrorhamnose 3,5-epimerase
MANYLPNNQNQVAERIYSTKINGLYYLAHDIHPDDRGFFAELNLIPDLEKVIGQPFPVKQVNLAQSKLNVCRGFHAEGWNKLISIVSGTGFCALADIRPQSPTFRLVETFVLGQAESALKGSLFIAKGIGNSVCTLEAPLSYLYLVDRLYRDRDTADEGATSMFDPSLNVSWPIEKHQMIISTRDQQAHNLS